MPRCRRGHGLLRVRRYASSDDSKLFYWDCVPLTDASVITLNSCYTSCYTSCQTSCYTSCYR